MSFVYHCSFHIRTVSCLIEITVILVFPLSLAVHAHLEDPSVYYNRNALLDHDHPVDDLSVSRELYPIKCQVTRNLYNINDRKGRSRLTSTLTK